MFNNITEECYHRSIELLFENSTEHGLMASTPNMTSKKTFYINIFGRDAGISVLGLIASKNKDLRKIAKNSLLSLASFQTKLGQIPSSVKPESETDHFYYLGSIDATLWWLIAIDYYDRNTNDKKLKQKLDKKIKKAIKWLFYQDTNNDGLLEQGEACDWADYMPNNGIVLYTNVLWIKVLEIYGLEDEKKLALDGLYSIFLPHEANVDKSIYLQKEKYREKTLDILKNDVEKIPYFLHYISFRYSSDRCDVYSNLLAIIFDLTDKKRANDIMSFIESERDASRYPIQTLFPPITRKDIDYREYLEEPPSLNKPYSYHNGGIWPFVGGFWVIALEKQGKKTAAWKELRRLAELNKKNNWEFNEWFDSKKLKPSGMKGQSWNAAMYVLAYNYLKGRIKI